MQDFNFYKVNETLNHKYYQIPQELFVNPLYKNTLNSDSKLLYGFLLDRLSLSIKNNWHDENGNVYLIFTRKEAQDKLNLSDKTVTKAFKQLSDVKLIYEKKQGFSKPKLIYVAKIQHQNIIITTRERVVCSSPRRGFTCSPPKGGIEYLTLHYYYCCHLPVALSTYFSFLNGSIYSSIPI